MAEGQVEAGGKRAPLVFLMVVFAYLLTATINAAMIPSYNMTDKIVPWLLALWACCAAWACLSR